MTWIVLISVVAGFGLGATLLDSGDAALLDRWVEAGLMALMFAVGIEIGRRPEAWAGLRRRGVSVLAVPVLVALGSIAAAGAAALALGMSPTLAGAVAAGFGWYSLAGAMLTRMVDPGAGALAFTANVFRELLTILLAVPLARFFGPLAPVAAGGATAMDTTMPVIARASGPQAALTGFASGVVLAAISPFLIEALVRLGTRLGL
ncbi:MAG TPA: lysine exporter LysO family protein [Bacillota bacterium]